jgi:hypothetical protein
MLANRISLIVIVLTLMSRNGLTQSTLMNGLYRISSGSFSACCGIAGDLGYSLPAQKQTYVRLQIDSQTNLATMTFLAQDKQTIFSVFVCPPADPFNFNFENGLVHSNQIFFHIDPGPPPDQKYWTYTVNAAEATLKIDGNLSVDPGGCADVPTQFSHSNVVAVWTSSDPLLIDKVERDAESFRFHFRGEAPYDYTVEYTDSLVNNNWLTLGTYQAKIAPIDVTVTNSLKEALSRFFRMRKEPCYCR